jgi:hypothetical protein
MNVASSQSRDDRRSKVDVGSFDRLSARKKASGKSRTLQDCVYHRHAVVKTSLFNRMITVIVALLDLLVPVCARVLMFVRNAAFGIGLFSSGWSGCDEVIGVGNVTYHNVPITIRSTFSLSTMHLPTLTFVIYIVSHRLKPVCPISRPSFCQLIATAPI